VLGIPRGHIARVEILGYAIMIIMGLVYISFPLYVMATKPFSGLVLGTETPDFEIIPNHSLGHSQTIPIACLD
jgi:hypothetical protein